MSIHERLPTSTVTTTMTTSTSFTDPVYVVISTHESHICPQCGATLPKNSQHTIDHLDGEYEPHSPWAGYPVFTWLEPTPIDTVV